MILVDVAWQDHDGSLHSTRACMENRSITGICIRCRGAIEVGSKLSIKGRWEQFSGVSKYCRSVGKEFLVGIQRDRVNSQPLPSVPTPKASLEQTRPAPTPVSTSPPQTPPPSPRPATVASPPHQTEPTVTYETLPSAEIIAAAMQMLRVGPRNEPHKPSVPTSRAPEHDDRKSLQKSSAHAATRPAEPHKEKKSMTRKWLEVGQWGKKDDAAAPDGSSEPSTDHVNGKSTAAESAAIHRAPSQHSEHAHPLSPASVGDSSHGFAIELSSMEDIYRAAGIVTPRRGYSVTKIAEMLHSEHIHGLAKDMRRAAVLMALDAAEVPVEEVLRDAKIRQQAIDNYEAQQRRQIEAEWARKSEENAQIQAELERVKSHYMERIKRNMEGMAREKAAFGSWLTMKQQESQSMSEAVDLCLKPVAAPQPAASSIPEMALPEAMAKPV
jgi:hypothetical protein